MFNYGDSTLISYIYVLIDPIDQKIKYVGKTDHPKKRLNEHIKKHKYTFTYKNNWIAKLHNNNLKPTLEIIDIVPSKEWGFWETYWITQIKSWGFVLYNLTLGGDGGNFGLSVNQKISQKLKNRKFSEETIKKMSDSAKNRKISEEGRKKLSEIRKGEKNPMYGKNQSNYCKESKYKPVLQLTQTNEFIKEWKSLKEVNEYLSINRNSIRMTCNGQRKTAGGYKWKFKEKNVH